MELSFLPPKDPAPLYRPDFQAFHDNLIADFGEDGKVEIPANAGSMLLEACQKGNWITVQEIIQQLERAWRQEEGHAGVRAAVNILDSETGRTPIIVATCEGKPEIVERLAGLGADTNIRDNDTLTALHYATASMKEDMVKLLISSGADCNIPGGKFRRLPLHLACIRRHGAYPVVQYLALLSGEDARMVQDNEGNLPVTLAAEHAHMAVVKELLKAQGIEQMSYHRQETNGDTVMHAVIRREQTDFLEIFLSADAPVNAQNNDGSTLLHVAASTSSAPAILLLHTHHANAEIVDKYDRTPIHLAVEKGLEPIANLLAEKYPGSIHFRTKDGSTLAHIAALSGHPETVVALLNKGAYLHMRNKYGASALHAAARTGHASVVRELLKRGSKVDAKTRDNYTALHLAIEYGKPSVVEVVLGAGASVHTKGGKNSETPLHIAARVPNGDVAISMLLRSGANVNTAMENGETALHVAARVGSLRMVKLLLKEGADAMVKSQCGETAFHTAVRACHYEIAKTLIEFIVAKWDRYDAVSVVNSANVEGETALHFVGEILPDMVHASKEDVTLLQLVLDYNAAAGPQTKLTFETPLHYCATSGNHQVLAALFKRLGHAKSQTVINRQSNTGWSPLLTACEGGQLAIVRVLLKNHARVDIFDDLGKAALHIAAENGHLEIVDLLLRSKVFVNAKTKAGITALHLAAMKGQADVVRLLVEKYDAPVDLFTVSRKTPLHLAAQYGQKSICEMLLKMRANASAVDDHGQNALHIAAECDNEEVVQLFLGVLAAANPLTIADMRGNTIAHIAAKNGSADVMQLLLQFNKEDIISSRARGSDATVLQVAAAGGHAELVKMLVAAGASASVENLDGLTAFHLAAKNGHLNVIEVLREVCSPKMSSLKNGLTALHLAAFYGQTEATREILTSVPATIRSDDPTVRTSVGSEVGAEAGLTPLHVACKAGEEAIVRMILNYPGVQLDAPTDRNMYIPLHMAAMKGHSHVGALLLSRFGNQLEVRDTKGHSALMLASARGHQDMVTLLIAAGADLAAVDKNGWTAVHHAAVAGRLKMVKLLCTSGVDTTTESTDKKIALCYAAHAAYSDRDTNNGHMKVMSYLMQRKMDCFSLMEDRVFLVDLMLCAKHTAHEPIREFINASSSPVELALKLCKFYRNVAETDSYHARDLIIAATFCQQQAGKLLSTACSRHKTSDILRAVDSGGVNLLDIMLDGGHKETVALLAVQQYLSTVFNGGLALKSWHIVLSFILCIFCPPLWLVLSMPWSHAISQVPFVKLLVQITSHMYFILLFILVFMSPFQHLYERTTMFPRPEEWLLLFWILGTLVAEITSHEERTGLGVLRSFVLIFSFLGLAVHLAAACTTGYTMIVLLYIRCQLFAVACFFADIQILSYLSFLKLFGPFAVMLNDIATDLKRFLVLFGLFIFGFAFSLSALYEDVSYHDPDADYAGNIMMDLVLDPFAALQSLYWALFKNTAILKLLSPRGNEQIPRPVSSPPYSFELIQVWYGIYLIATVVALISVLVAMFSDTYDRVKVRSDLDWSYIRGKIIINLEKTPISPPPINTFTVIGGYIVKWIARETVHSLVNNPWDKTVWIGVTRNRAQRKVYSDHEVREVITASNRDVYGQKILAEATGSKVGLVDSPVSRLGPVLKLIDVIDWKKIVQASEGHVETNMEANDDE